MTARRCHDEGMTQPQTYEPIETASLDELQSLQLSRMQWSLAHAYDNVDHYRNAFDLMMPVCIRMISKRWTIWRSFHSQ